MKNGDMPAAPMLNEHGCPQHYASVLLQQGQVTGLTKRELIAAMAMQGLASVPCQGGLTDEAMAYDISSAVRYADALLAELERTA